MKIGIFGDIHSNLEALTCIHSEFTARGITNFFSVGDVVGYGPNPAECIEFLDEIKCQTVMGNHDMAVWDGLFPLHWFNPIAETAARWTKKQLKERHFSWLRNLKTRIDFLGISIVHASFDNPFDFKYLWDEKDALPSFELIDIIGFCGHTHIPSIFVQTKKIDPSSASFGKETGVITLDVPNSKVSMEGIKSIINVGSVGQPRDRDWRACGVVYDLKTQEIEFIRKEYDIELTNKKIKNTNHLPMSLGERLFHGK